MRTISLWQPWATLVAVGAKRIETRHWPAPATLVGQRIGIHAAKTTAHLAICGEWPFNEHIPDPRALPLGAVVATAVLARCREITSEGAALLEERDRQEAAFGLYAPGRFAWVLRDVVALEQPVPFRGSQGFFDVPDEALGFERPQGALL
jgi:hypothetical protein